MTEMMLQVVDGGLVVDQIHLGTHPVTVGRAPDNHLVLRAEAVSAHHALFFQEEDTVYVQDLGSTNGTFVNGTRIVRASVGPDDRIQIGPLEFRIRGTYEPTTYQIVTADSPVAWTVEDGFSIPGHEEATVFLRSGGITLALPGGSCLDVDPGESFTLGDTCFTLVEAPPTARTVPLEGRFPYQLDIFVETQVARLSAPNLDPVQFTAATRVSLLYLLANKDGRWVDDAELGPGIWGRAWARQDPNNINVLLHRVRQQVAERGYDRRFIERRRGAMRLRVERATTH